MMHLSKPTRCNLSGHSADLLHDPIIAAEIALRETVNPVQRQSIIYGALHSYIEAKHAENNRKKHPEKYRAFKRFDAMLQSEDFHEWLMERGLYLMPKPNPIPGDIRAEFGVIGALIVDLPGMAPEAPSAITQSMARLRTVHFSCFRMAPIFRAVTALHHQKKKEPDIRIWPDTVEIQLMLSGTWTEAGGAEMLDALWHQRCEPEDVSSLIDVILEASKMRHLALAARYLSDVTLLDRDNPARLINAMRRALDQIEQRGACNMDALLKETK